MSKSLKSKALLLRKIKLAYRLAVESMFNDFQKIIETPQTWEGFENSVTFRQNGEVIVGANRNIEDTGNLKNSQKVTFNDAKGKLQAVISWDGNGITPVHVVLYGGVNESGAFTPGRDWITPVIQEKSFRDRFLDAYESL